MDKDISGWCGLSVKELFLFPAPQRIAARLTVFNTILRRLFSAFFFLHILYSFPGDHNITQRLQIKSPKYLPLTSPQLYYIRWDSLIIGNIFLRFWDGLVYS